MTDDFWKQFAADVEHNCRVVRRVQSQIVDDGKRFWIQFAGLIVACVFVKLVIYFGSLALVPVIFYLFYRISYVIYPQYPEGHCYKCGYDLRVNPAFCPECGTKQ